MTFGAQCFTASMVEIMTSLLVLAFNLVILLFGKPWHVFGMIFIITWFEKLGMVVVLIYSLIKCLLIIDILYL